MPPVLRPRAERHAPADHEPTSANTSRRLETLETSTSRKRQKVDMGPSGVTLECGQCTRSLEDGPRHQCQRCPQIQYCLRCSIDAEYLHPDHPFKLVRPSRHSRHIAVAERVLEATAGGLGTVAEKSDRVPEHRMSEDGAGLDRPDGNLLAECPFRLPRCASCQEVLADLRYECQECHDTNFCSDCRTAHYLHHTLKCCTGPVMHSDSSSGEPNEEDAEDSNELSDGDLFSTELGIGTVDDPESDKHESIEGTESDNSAPGERKSRDDEPGSERNEDDIETVGTHEPQEISQRGDTGEDNTEDADLTLAVRPTAQTRLPSSSTGPIEVTYTDFAQMTAAMTRAMNNMQTMVRAAEHILRAHGSSRNTTEDGVLVPKTMATSGINHATRDSAFVPETLFGVPVELATLDNDDSELDDYYSESDRCDDTARSSTRKRKQRHAPRQWTAEDQRQLRKMKKNGWTDARIGLALNRSAGAVSQQWRKQKQ